MNRARKYAASRRAFTLIEVMLALGISAVILAAIGGVFYSAMRLRDRTSAALDEAAPRRQAFAMIRRDFEGIQPPGGSMVGIFKAEPLSSGNGGMSSRLQLFTTSGAINATAPWGDLQGVLYELREPVSGGSQNNGGRDLIRTVTRNLLATAAQEFDEQWVMGNVQSLQFSCYDGANWRDSWDTSLGDTNLPAAIKVRIQMATDNTTDARKIEPYEMLVPILSQSRTNTQTSTSSGGAQ